MTAKEEIAFQNGFEAGSIAGLEVASEALGKIIAPNPIIVHDVERIRQEAIEEFRAGILEEMEGFDEFHCGALYAYESAIEYVKSYNLPTK